MFQKYRESGFCVIPLKNGVPLVEWSKYFNSLPDDVSEWRGEEYALVCGKVSGVVAVDIDIDDTDRIEMLAGVSPVKKQGSKGFTAFYRYSGEKSTNWKDASGNVICEILSDKRLTTIPPSPHRKTKKPYIWMDKELIGTELPLLNDDFIVIMDAKFPKPRSMNVEAPKAIVDFDDVTLAQTKEMLSYIPADCARDEWVQIGMALRDEFGDAACHLWHSWSEKAASKYKHNDAQAAWRSFGGSGVTVATLVYYAKRNGWVAERQQVKPISREKKIAVEEKKGGEVKISGIVGDIANWITSTAVKPQPKLSLAAALSFVAVMKGHRVKSSIRGARTNLLIMSLARTGGGKDHPQEAIQKLMKRCGIQKTIMGRPTSGTALLTGINKASGVSWLKVDEIGRFLANISNKSAGGFQKEIVDYIIELYSSANRTFYGRQYANDEANPQIVIEQPHFCCLGSTVEEKLSSASNSSEVIDGFLNRWLVFKTSDSPKKDLSHKDYEPPKELVDKIVKWLNDFPINRDNYGEITPQEIELTPEAWAKFLAYEEKVEDLTSKVAYPLNELYARAGEHVIKVATAIADDLWVGTPEIDSAIAIVDESIENILSFASGIADNQHEQNVLYVLDVIKKAGAAGVTQNQITQRTRKLTNRERIEILNQIVEAGNVTVEKDGKKTTFVYCN